MDETKQKEYIENKLKLNDWGKKKKLEGLIENRLLKSVILNLVKRMLWKKFKFKLSTL